MEEDCRSGMTERLIILVRDVTDDGKDDDPAFMTMLFWHSILHQILQHDGGE